MNSGTHNYSKGKAMPNHMPAFKLCSGLLLLLIVLSVHSKPVRAQNAESKMVTIPDNALYVELLGSVFPFSINYERKIIKDYFIRAGGYYLIAPSRYSSDHFDIYGGTFMLNKLVGPGRSKLELGLGYTFTNSGSSADSDNKNHEYIKLWNSLFTTGGLTTGVGFRRYTHKKALFRVGFNFTAGKFFESQKGLLITPGLSLGGAF